jgi:hypothetical protein
MAAWPVSIVVNPNPSNTTLRPIASGTFGVSR